MSFTSPMCHPLAHQSNIYLFKVCLSAVVSCYIEPAINYYFCLFLTKSYLSYALLSYAVLGYDVME